MPSGETEENTVKNTKILKLIKKQITRSEPFRNDLCCHHRHL